MTFKRKASATQINMFLTCPLRWYWKYIAKQPEPTTTAMLKGTLVHATVERMSTDFNPRKSTVNGSNYKTEFFKYIYDVFNDELLKPQSYFGKPRPSIKEQLGEICADEVAVAMEIADAKVAVKNYMTIFLLQLEEQIKKSPGGFSQAYYMLRPKFSEYEIVDDEFTGFIDEVFDKGGEIILSDLKTGGSYYKVGYSEDYRIQLSLYCYYYWKQFGVLPKYGVIKFVKLGRECLYPFSMDTIKEMEELLQKFREGTKSTNIMDYRPGLDHTFCCSKYAQREGSRGKDWCPHRHLCDKHILSNGLIPVDFIQTTSSGDEEVADME